MTTHTQNNPHNIQPQHNPTPAIAAFQWNPRLRALAADLALELNDSSDNIPRDDAAIQASQFVESLIQTLRQSLAQDLNHTPSSPPTQNYRSTG